MPDIICDPKRPGEEYPLSFNFSAELGTLTEATVTVDVLYGEDATPSAILSGTVTLSGTSALQRITGGVPGCVYGITCSATDATTSTYELRAVLSIVSDTPAMVPETGAGVEGSNTYADVDYLDVYHASRGNVAWLAYPVSEKEAAALRGMEYIETFKCRGQKVLVSQNCNWPRTGVITKDGLEWPVDKVPPVFLKAQAEAALREILNPGVLLPDWTPGKGPKRREKLGDMEDEWFKQDPNEGKYPFQSILRLLGDFIVDPTVDKSKTLYVFDVERA